jgi:hypothetical protein
MSYDPYAPDYDAGDDDVRPPEDRGSARSRVQAPAICLIVVGVLNLFWGLYMVVNGVAWTVAPEYLSKSNKQMFGDVGGAGQTTQQQQMQGMLVSYPLAIVALVGSALPIVGGIRMMSLKSYGLAVTAAVTAAIPCVSGTACCGLGEGIGIWALVVLLNESVREAFR